MRENTVYKDILLDHFHNPRNYSEVKNSQRVNRGRIPRCGDDIKVGVDIESNTLTKVVFQGRACSVCMASASLMTESVKGLSIDEFKSLSVEIKNWFDNQNNDFTEAPIEFLNALDAVRKYPARRKCVLLAWEAMDGIIDAE